MTGICQESQAARADVLGNAFKANELADVVVYTSGVAKHVGNEIERLQRLKGWKLPEFSRRSGIDKTTLNRIVLGKRRPQRSTLRLIVAALDITRSDTTDPRLLEALDDAAAIGGARSSSGIEDRLSGLLDYVKTLKGKARSDFIRAGIALLTALEHPSAAESTGTAPHDDR
jgi:transcriptional regulator with XRE-family HTH domain